MNAPTEDLRSWAGVAARLSEFVRVAAQAGDAIDAGDAPRARVLVNETRAIRAALARVTGYAQQVPIPKTAEGVELLRRLRALREESEIADRIARAWIERALPPDEELEKLSGGHHAIADRLLPATWDATVDLIVLIDPSCGALAHALRDFGQKRILVCHCDDLDEDEFPDDVIFASKRAELGRMLAYSEGPPERLKIHVCDPTLDEDDLEMRFGVIQESFDSLILGRNTVECFGGLWLEQGLGNLSVAARGGTIASIGERFAGHPMVIVAPGPSLEKNVALLKEIEGRAIIATFSHTLSALRANGVTPNIVIAVDMEDLRYHFDDFPMEDIDALVVGLTVHPDLYRSKAPATLCVAGNGDTDHWLCQLLDKEEIKLASGGSVAHTAFSLGRKWGCNPIALVGQDLSFPDGKVYCDSNVDGETVVEVSEDGESLVLSGWSDGYANLDSIGGRRAAPSEPVVRVPANGGGEVMTSTVFSLFRRWFIDAVETSEGTTLLNCTEGGAHIDGFQHITLREAIDEFFSQHQPIDIGAEIAAAVREEQDTSESVLAAVNEVKRALRRTKKSVTKCLRLLREVEVATPRKSADKLAKLGAAERALARNLQPLSFVALAAQEEIRRARNQARDTGDLTGNVIASRRLFETIQNACELLTEPLARCIDELEGRTP